MSSPKEIFNKHAIAYQERFMDFELYNDTYDALCDFLKSKAKILEIGCGPGNITKYLLSKRLDLEILGIDLAENMIELATQNCPSATFKVMDCRDISSLEQKFDALVCGFCLPYLDIEEIKKLVSDAKDLLVNNGILYISAIEKDHHKSGYQKSSNGEDTCMIYYYQERDLRAILNTSHFDDPQLFRKNYGADTHLILIARKK